MKNRNFPTTSHHFPTIINSGAVYVDKTPFILSLMARETKSNFFLSRPRRFGKSMFLSMLEQFFLGKKELFKGLFIEDKMPFDPYPVIRFSMDRIGFTEMPLERALVKAVQDIAETEALILNEDTPGLAFQKLIHKLFDKYQKRVVVLIDEYDKPIISYLEKDKITQAEDNRDTLKSFYGILKDNGEYLRLVFITGVSKFSKVSIFSDLNYFTDLTLDANYATICGFTEAEIRQYCEGGVEALSQKEAVSVEEIMDKIRYWYDGFSWDGETFVYNPYSTMRVFDSLVFDNHWFETGTPTLLVKQVNAEFRFGFKDLSVDSSIYEAYDLRKIPYISLMLQTGYLTFKKALGEKIFKIDYPNKEVEHAFTKFLLAGYLNQHTALTTITILDIQTALIQHDIHRVMAIISDMFKLLPLQFFQEPREKTDKQGYKQLIYTDVGETFYHAIIFLIFKILGIQMHAEVSAQDGRIDAMVETDNYVYLFEFKKDRSPKAALNQIKKQAYEKLFALSKKQIFSIGVGFSAKAKGISNYAIDPEIA